jgi:hypothetical protein
MAPDATSTDPDAPAPEPPAGAEPSSFDDPVDAGIRARPEHRHASERFSEPEQGPGTPAERVLAGLRERQTIQTLAAASLAWGTTVAPAAFARGAPAVAAALGAAALLAGIAGPTIAVLRRRLGRHLGLSLFLFCSTGTWLASNAAITPLRLDPTRATIGAIAWGVFALSWSDPWTFRRDELADPKAPALQARSTLPPFAVPIAAAGVLAALACLAFAWRVRDPSRAMLAQGTAIACAVALITASATVAVARGKRSAGATRLTPAAVRPLMMLVAVGIAGAVMFALR